MVQKKKMIFVLILTVLLLSCNLPLGLLEESRPPTNTPVPATQEAATATQAETTATQPAPTETLPGLEPFAVVTEVIKAEEKAPPSPYVVDIEYPVFSGGPAGEALAGAADGINARVLEIVTRQRAGFEEMVKNTPADPQIGPHGFYMRYEVRQNDGKYTSVYFQLSLYSSGAAHPLPYSETLNFDVAQNRALELGELFQPGTDYLGLLSQKSLAWLQSEGITGGEAGAEPTPENYRNWLITPGGLQIVFDPYQVAAYAMGYVTYTIPWPELEDVTNYDG